MTYKSANMAETTDPPSGGTQSRTQKREWDLPILAGQAIAVLDATDVHRRADVEVAALDLAGVDGVA